MIRAVTFDAAGTLVTPCEEVGVTYARAAARFGVPIDPALAEVGFRRAFATAPPLAFPGATKDQVPALERSWWRSVVGTALGLDDGTTPLDACVDALLRHYASADAWRVHADVEPALATLRRRGLALGVVSNFDGRLPALLDDLGLADAFATIVWSTNVGAAKPDAAIFDAAAAALGLPPAAILHLGDDPDLDVAGARAAGFQAWHVDRTSTGLGLSTVAARLDLAS